jgi:hypothetical protein
VSAKNKNKRAVAQAEIMQEMVDYGPGRDWSILWRSRYPDVKKPTWYRWVNAVKAGGVAAKAAAKTVKAKSDRRSRQAPKKSTRREVTASLPTVVSPNDVASSGILSVMNEVRNAVARAKRVLDMCETSEGKLRNPKLFLEASRHSMEALRTAAIVANQMMDAQQTERFHQAVIDCIEETDRDTAERILRRLKDLNVTWRTGLVRGQ